MKLSIYDISACIYALSCLVENQSYLLLVCKFSHYHLQVLTVLIRSAMFGATLNLVTQVGTLKDGILEINS